MMHVKTGVVLAQQILVCLINFLPLTMATSGDYENTDEDLPFFLPRPTNVSFNRGDTAVLVCGIENLGTKTVIWRRASDPNPLTIGTHVYVSDPRYSAKPSTENKEWRLVIEDVRTSDAGVYECQISSRAKLIHHVLLRVNATERPERKNYVNFKQGIFVSGTKYVEKGDRIHLVCNSTGVLDSPEDLVWFKDGIKMTPDGLRQVKIDKFHVRATRTLVSVLEIKHSLMDDSGTYVCRSSDLSITSTKVHVLNAGSINVRRAGTSATDKAGDDSNTNNDDNNNYSNDNSNNNHSHNFGNSHSRSNYTLQREPRGQSARSGSSAHPRASRGTHWLFLLCLTFAVSGSEHFRTFR